MTKQNNTGLKVTTKIGLEKIVTYMVHAINNHNWDLKDLVHYFEQDNNFDYKIRVKIWNDMNMFEKTKNYGNILKLLTEIVEGNNLKLN